MFAMKLSAAAAAIVAVMTAHAADPKDESKKSLSELIDAATVDMPVTTAPAVFLLGASGETVQRMASFRAFSSQVSRAFDADGKVANAVAVEIAPALAMKSLTWSDITKSGVSRAWARTTVSIATKVKTDKTPAQSAVGVQSLLWAPVMDSALDLAGQGDCVAVATGDFGKPPSLEPAPAAKQPLNDKEKAVIEACQKLLDSALTKWNQPKVAIGFGRRIASSEGLAVNQPKDSTAYWLTAAYGGDFGSKLDDATSRSGYLVTAHLRSTSKVPTSSIVGTEVLARQRLLGVNARVGNARLGGIAEYSVAKSHATAAAFNDRKRTLLGLEYKIDKDMYLTVGTARDTGADVKSQSVLARLHWGFGKEPVLLPR